MAKWLAVVAVVGGLGAGVALYSPGVPISRMPVGRLVDGQVVPGEVVYVHSSRGCRFAGSERVAPGAVPPGAVPCPHCR
jgi:hypothetical protein